MQAATRIIAVRHGETAWNVDTRVQGHLDIPLNAVGERQAAQLAEALAAEPVDAVYASDLQRAFATGAAIARATGARLVAEPRLRERHFGGFQGHTFAASAVDRPDEALRWRKRDPDWVPDGGGESLQQLRARILGALAELAAGHAGGQIVIATHGGVLDVLHRAATGQDLQAPRTWTLANAAINRLLWTPDALTLVGWADAGHLAQARDEPVA